MLGQPGVHAHTPRGVGAHEEEMSTAGELYLLSQGNRITKTSAKHVILTGRRGQAPESVLPAAPSSAERGHPP